MVLSTLLVISVALTSCAEKTLVFCKNIQNQVENYGTNINFYESTDVYETESGEHVLVSLKAFWTINEETDTGELSFNFELNGFEAEESLGIKNIDLNISVERGSLISCELYDCQKLSKNFYVKEATFNHQFKDEININNQYLSAVFAVSGDSELLGITVDMTYDLMNASTQEKSSKISLSI